MVERSSGNPYDFRSPVRRRHLLAGRASELQEIDDLLRRAAVGQPAHISLFGAPGSGKSSLLNSVGAIATERQLLPITLELRDATVESELAFYADVFEAGLQALIDTGALKSTDALMRAWVRQTRAGDLTVTQEEQPFEIGLLLAAKANGKMVGGVPAPALQRDLQLLVQLGSGSNVRGAVLCLDGAENIDQNDDLAPSLLALANASSLLTIVTAAETAGALHATAPRAWARIEVGPFLRPRDVFDAMVRPLQLAEEADFSPNPATAEDVYALTRGNPYEISLVCHFIWDSVHKGEQAAFELSPAVIERVLHELEEKGRHETSVEFAAFSRLTAADYDSLAELAPYESLTVRQIALLRLMPQEHDEPRLAQTEAQIVDELGRLDEQGVLRFERDRFELRGASDARLYLKYAAQRHTGKRLRYGDTYERQVTIAFSGRLGEALVGPTYQDALLYGQGEPYEVGGIRTASWVRELRDSVCEQNIVRFSEMLLGADALSAVRDAGDRGGIFFGLVLEVGVHEVEHAELLINTESATETELQERAAAWTQQESQLLAQYGVRVLERYCVVVPSTLLAAVAVYARLELMVAIATIMYEAGSPREALDALSTCVREAEALIGEEPTDPLIRSELAEALSRLGFMTATLGHCGDALALFDRCERLGLQDHWLLDFNRAYAHARLTDKQQAARMATAAEEKVAVYDGVMILLACPPTPDGWVAPSRTWNVVRLKGGWVRRFVALQAAIMRAEADPDAVLPLRDLVDGLSPAAPPALLRLAAWAEATLLERPAKAIERFEKALDASRLADIEIVRAELEYVRDYSGGGNDDGTDSGATDRSSDA